MRLLSFLLDILFPPRDTEALARAATYETVLPLMRPRGHRIGGYPCVTLLPYRHPTVRALVIEAKFRGSTHAQRILGLILRDYLMDETASVTLVPVPLGSERFAERGYNQVAEMAKHSGMGTAQVLERVRETPPQTSVQGRSRVRNMQGAFRATAINPATSYIVLDDVMTTGATLTDAARALTEAGATRVAMLALAH